MSVWRVHLQSVVSIRLDTGTWNRIRSLDGTRAYRPPRWGWGRLRRHTPHWCLQLWHDCLRGAIIFSCRIARSSFLVSPYVQILTGGPPFAHRRHDTSVISDVYNGRRPRRPTKPEVTDTIWEIIQNCWHQEPTKRPSISYVGFWLTLLHQTRSVEAKEASP